MRRIKVLCLKSFKVEREKRFNLLSRFFKHLFQNLMTKSTI